MKAFCIQLGIQFRCDLRDKGVLLVYYLVPLVMYFVLGAIVGAMSHANEDYMLQAVACLFTISMSAYIGLPQPLARAREQGVLNAYRVAGIPAWGTLLSHVLIAFLHIMIVCVIITFTAPLIFDVPPAKNPAAFFGVIALVTIASEALGTFVSAVVSKANAVMMLGQVLFLASIMFSGIMFPAELLPDGLAAVGSVLPSARAQLAISGKDAALNLGILTAVAVVAFVLAVLLFARRNRKQ